MNNLAIKSLFKGNSDSFYLTILKKISDVTLFSKSDSLSNYELLVIDGESENNFKSLFNDSLRANISIAIFNITAKQINTIATSTGISPSTNASGAIVGMSKASGLESNPVVKYLPNYPEEYFRHLDKMGMSREDILGSFIDQGINSHFRSINNVAIIPSNNLFPKSSLYSEVPFGIVKVSQKTISLPVGMHNISALSLGFEASLYCYKQSLIENDGYFIIAVCKMNNVYPANQVLYSGRSSNSCSNTWQSWCYGLWFSYSLNVSVLDSAGTPISSGLSVPASSPTSGNASNVSIDQPITMNAISSDGSPTTYPFTAKYTNPKLSNAGNFGVTRDSSSSNTSGTKFSISQFDPQDHGLANPVSGDLEYVTVFFLDKSLETSGTLAVTLNFDINLEGGQQYCQSSGGGGGNPTSYCHSPDSWNASPQTVKSEQFDLVHITAEKPIS